MICISIRQHEGAHGRKRRSKMDKVHAFLLKVAESDWFIAFEGFLADYGLYIAAFLFGFLVAYMICWAAGKRSGEESDDESDDEQDEE